MGTAGGEANTASTSAQITDAMLAAVLVEEGRLTATTMKHWHTMCSGGQSHINCPPCPLVASRAQFRSRQRMLCLAHCTQWNHINCLSCPLVASRAHTHLARPSCPLVASRAHTHLCSRQRMLCLVNMTHCTWWSSRCQCTAAAVLRGQHRYTIDPCYHHHRSMLPWP